MPPGGAPISRPTLPEKGVGRRGGRLRFGPVPPTEPPRPRTGEINVTRSFPRPARPFFPRPARPFVYALPCLLALSLGTGLNARDAIAADAYTIDHVAGSHVDLVTPSGDPLLRYVYLRDTSDDQKGFDTAKVFAHVMAPGGEETLTKGPGGLFPHHRGIFVGWNKIRHDGKSHDLWHVRNTEQRNVSVEHGADESGAFVRATIDWNGSDGETLIRETRTYRVVADESAHAVIDLTSDLKAVAGDLVLDGDPEHAGVQFRPSQKVAENKSARYIFPTPDADPKKDLDLPWVACHFEIDGTTWTVQHMNHPENPTGARWSAYRDYGRFGPFPVIELAGGETVELQFRFRIVAREIPSREPLASAYAEWTE